MRVSRSKYWSCTPFADWVRGNVKPQAATMDEWDEWKKFSRTSHKIRFWMAEEGLDKLQDIVYFIPDLIHTVRYYVNNRWIDKTHYLRTGLKPGDWHEFDTRILHGLFTELVDFVEVEAAWFNVVWDKDSQKKFNYPWWRNWYRLWRSPESGKSYFEWSAALVKNEEWGLTPGEPGYGDLTDQAIAARKTLELYHWWTVDRPARPDVYDVTGWSKYCADTKTFGKTEPKDEAKVSKMLESINLLEAQYEAEDTEKMIDLIKLRKHLWT